RHRGRDDRGRGHREGIPAARRPPLADAAQPGVRPDSRRRRHHPRPRRGGAPPNLAGGGAAGWERSGRRLLEYVAEAVVLVGVAATARIAVVTVAGAAPVARPV